MKTITQQLPTVLGSFAAMLVAFFSLMSGTAPTGCLMKAAAAFLVFAGFGLILRYLLMEPGTEQSTSRQSRESRQPSAQRSISNGLDVIVPGTSVADLLGSVDGED